MPGLSRRGFLQTAIMTSAVLSLGGPVAAYADTEEEMRARAADVAAKLVAWQQQLDQDSDAYYQALDEHDAAVVAMEDARARYDEASAQILVLQGNLGERANSMYRGGKYRLLDVLLGSVTFEGFVNNWSFLEKMNEDDQMRIDELVTTRAAAQAAYEESLVQEQIAADKLAESERIAAEAADVVALYQAEYDGLDAELAALVEQEKEEAYASAGLTSETTRFEESVGFVSSQETAASGTGSTATSASGSVSGASSGSGSTSSSPTPGSGSQGGTTSGTTSTSSSQPEPEPEPEPEPDPVEVPSSGVADTVVSAAYSQLGVPYVWGGSEPYVGLDCSGLVQYCYSCAGISLPRWSQNQRNAGYRIPLSSAEPGDILGNSHHVGIYIGGGRFIHAPDVGDYVKISSYMGMFVDATRIV